MSERARGMERDVHANSSAHLRIREHVIRTTTQHKSMKHDYILLFLISYCVWRLNIVRHGGLRLIVLQCERPAFRPQRAIFRTIRGSGFAVGACGGLN